ncbi:dihydropyrimidinase [Desulfonatronum thiosulfatophilum]|uniref:Dihydropyrimidinase n=1 Tax=Desulfonatronum thiosulfatophilum TaxID=617002 RepID=A0A1G6EHG8_9BACT|nr:dihydropyrimidinase [Desulfonatronum thiosulfatophilum]SDB56923.1 dihydropyrimidinase [Desulfonatronum thiosulfatophilum]
MSLLIRGATVVNADCSALADIYIRNGKIAAVGPDLDVLPETKVVDAGGVLALPGGIDPHTHLDMPIAGTRTADNFEQGGRAALAGGTTMVVDFVIPRQGQSFLEAHNRWMGFARSATCDYSFHMAVTWFDESVAQEMGVLTRERGVNSFKHYMAYKGTVMLDPERMLDSFVRAAELGCLCTVHAENAEIIPFLQRRLLARGMNHPRAHPLCHPAYGEAEATQRAIALAEAANVPLYVVHLSCSQALDAVVAARNRGLPVFAECLGGHLAVDEAVYEQEDPAQAARFVMSPPFRSARDRAALWEGLATGSIQVVASDNCSFTDAQRADALTDFSRLLNGTPGLEDRMRVVWDGGVAGGRLTPEQFVAVTSANAARIFNIYPRKGCIRPGADADIVLWDPDALYTVSARNHHHAVDFSVFEGMTFRGAPVATYLAGKEVFRDGQVTAEPGIGRHIPRPVFGSDFRTILEMLRSSFHNKKRYNDLPEIRHP